MRCTANLRTAALASGIGAALGLGIGPVSVLLFSGPDRPKPMTVIVRQEVSALMDKRRTTALERVELYTDGACSGNPGPGGWAYILKHPTTGKVLDGSGAELETTNNRMELMGAIQGLSALKRPCRVELITDSHYLGKGLMEWLPKWKAQGWQRKEGKSFKPVVNLDLWKRLDELLGRHDVHVRFVLGHNGHPENEQCDRMAVAAYRALMAEQR